MKQSDVVGWGWSPPRIITNAVSAVTGAVQSAVDVAQNAVETVQDVASAAYQSEIMDMVQNAVELTVDAAQSVQEQYSDIKETVSDVYADTGIKAFVDASAPLLSALDKLAEDAPLVGDMYSSGKNVYISTMAVIETAKAYYELYAGDIPEQGMAVVDDIKAMINQYFAFLGWY
ncbi:MAG: hypothetical protein CVV49_00110 [Spirochaetae bacterium HGW-Spirochaetae-5]|nr:MAG: hypothetical protein CVV49_00110 [Spirochaetae bacterium HGW-Spirochaetae-5]